MNHRDRAEAFLREPGRAAWHDRVLWQVRAKRDAAVQSVAEWEELRDLAAAIKAYALANLDCLLEQFESAATARGAIVHWADDAAAHNRIVGEILSRHGVDRVVKSKSMLTEECGLNHYLAGRGIEVVDTDLGERIVQLRGEVPSHIVLPAIHLRRDEVGDLFHARLGTPAGCSDPAALTAAARADLRSAFRGAAAGITGVNFAIAESGGIVVCTNEGNADLGTALPPLHIACMGIEKVIPRAADLGVFTRVLARSATGQAITAYTAHMHGPRRGGELHIVVVDDGRSELMGRPRYRRSLACIRCGACLNTCPVYRRSGGHSYDAVVPGPIGSTLGPARDAKRHASLPYACTLCGSCTDVCPVKIDLHDQLVHWRREVVSGAGRSLRSTITARAAAFVLGRPWLWGVLRRAGAMAVRVAPVSMRRLAGPWTKARELPVPPRRSFREQMRGGADD